jgi:selenocysteine lyase/cysteine desulfurase
MPGIDLAAARAQFPSTGTAVHFDHASVGPISVRVSDAMRDVATVHSASGFQNSWRDDIEHVRSLIATFVGSTPGNIAFTQNTSTGLSIAANGIDWRRGDNVVLPAQEFPSNHYPWLNLERQGVQLRRVPAPDGNASLDAIAGAIDRNTRVVTVSAVQYSNGHRYDLDALGEACRQHGGLFVVDGTQSVGALTIDCDRSAIDLLAVSSHKWMLGPPGIGFVHVSDRALARIRADIVGWLSVREPFAFDGRLDLPDTADRYEPGTENVIGTLGLGAAVSLFLEHGTEQIEQRVLGLTDRICDRLRRCRHQIVSPRAPAERSGIIIFRAPDRPAEELHARLMAAGIRCAPRNGGIRFSPHFYNNDDDIDAALDALGPTNTT